MRLRLTVFRRITAIEPEIWLIDCRSPLRRNANWRPATRCQIQPLTLHPCELDSGTASRTRSQAHGRWCSTTLQAIKSIYRVAQNVWNTFCTPYNFIKYWRIFQLFFTIRIRRKLVILPHIEYVATLPCEMQCIKATNENYPTSVTTHFKSSSSSSKADTLNIWCKNCRMWQLL